MESSKSNKGFKVALGVLAALLLGSVVFGTKLYSDQKQVAMNLEEDKKELIKEYEDIKLDMEEMEAENDILNQDLADFRMRIDKYVDSLKSAKADVAYLRRFRKQVRILKDERKRLMAENDSLRSSNRLLTLERDSTLLALDAERQFTDSLAVQNLELAKIVAEGSAITLSGLNAEGIKVRSSGKLVSTERAKRADKVRVCFSLSENKIAKSGDRMFYLQVLDPNNNVLGENAILSEGEESLNYSKKTKFFYENQVLDVCDYIDPASGTELAKGRYIVNIFEDFKLVSQTEFTLK
ncbi:hypothetical protein ACFQ1M_05940 [Sungkyunkwania multivorans]|uniref:Chromosome partitioning protein ParA n=1 Tax=Sungkyunkwania multivorans TaxID=1173618 RepID=A0ABW3CXY7_9FLAO